MNKYSVILSPKAAKQLKKLHTVIKERIKECIDALASNPRPHGVKKLVGSGVFYRVRVSDYRIVYKIQDKQLVILVLAVANRKDVYTKKFLI